jgi:hypothetical protein
VRASIDPVSVSVECRPHASPFVGPFPPGQHLVGPWAPIQHWQESHAADLRAAASDPP